MRLVQVTLAFCLLFLALPTSAQIFGPRNYDDCIIEGMQGVTSDIAARAIERACYNKFRTRSRSIDTPTVDYEGTCDFYFDPDTRGLSRLRKGEGENLANVKAHLSLGVRNDVTQREVEALAQALHE